jgi:hypothetical protein
VCTHQWHWGLVHLHNTCSQLSFPSLVHATYSFCFRYFIDLIFFFFSFSFTSILNYLFVLTGCSQLTSSGLSNLIQLRQLEELELTNCPGSSKELIGYLRDNLQKCLVVEWTCQTDKQSVCRFIAWMILQCFYKYQS